MKTQIIHRIILIAILISISYSNKGDNTQATMPASSITILNSCAPCIKKTFQIIAAPSEKGPSFCCIFCTHENESPAIPEPSGEHEFHVFHVKDKTSRHAGFWNAIANKIVEAVYYIVVLFTYISFKH